MQPIRQPFFARDTITVARELREKGHELLGVRLDSGDLAFLSRQARHLFDEAGFPNGKIVASNELDDGFDASPAIVGDTLYLRGREYLYAIAD